MFCIGEILLLAVCHMPHAPPGTRLQAGQPRSPYVTYTLLIVGLSVVMLAFRQALQTSALPWFGVGRSLVNCTASMGEYCYK